MQCTAHGWMYGRECGRRNEAGLSTEAFGAAGERIARANVLYGDRQAAQDVHPVITHLFCRDTHMDQSVVVSSEAVVGQGARGRVDGATCMRERSGKADAGDVRGM